MARVVVITGASGGIGAELARQLGQRGEQLVLAARREAELGQSARAASPTAVPVVADATRRPDVEKIREAALKAFGHVDVWVNNAGRGITRRVMDLTDDDLDQMMAVNVKSALYGIQAIVPHFLERRAGHLINVSSMLGRVPFVPARSAYGAAKSFLNALTANLRAELRATCPAIQVSLVMPGAVRTDFAKNALGGTPPYPPGGNYQTQSAEEVAALLVNLIEHPVAELYTQPSGPEMVRSYYQDVVAFEATRAARS